MLHYYQIIRDEFNSDGTLAYRIMQTNLGGYKLFPVALRTNAVLGEN